MMKTSSASVTLMNARAVIAILALACFSLLQVLVIDFPETTSLLVIDFPTHDSAPEESKEMQRVLQAIAVQGEAYHGHYESQLTKQMMDLSMQTAADLLGVGKSIYHALRVLDSTKTIVERRWAATAAAVTTTAAEAERMAMSSNTTIQEQQEEELIAANSGAAAME